MKTVAIKQTYSYSYQIIQVDKVNDTEIVQADNLELSDAITQHQVLNDGNTDVNILYFIVVDYAAVEDA